MRIVPKRKKKSLESLISLSSPPELKQGESKQNNPPKQTDKQQNYVAIVF